MEKPAPFHIQQQQQQNQNLEMAGAYHPATPTPAAAVGRGKAPYAIGDSGCHFQQQQQQQQNLEMSGAYHHATPTPAAAAVDQGKAPYAIGDSGCVHYESSNRASHFQQQQNLEMSGAYHPATPTPAAAAVDQGKAPYAIRESGCVHYESSSGASHFQQQQQQNLDMSGAYHPAMSKGASHVHHHIYHAGSSSDVPWVWEHAANGVSMEQALQSQLLYDSSPKIFSPNLNFFAEETRRANASHNLWAPETPYKMHQSTKIYESCNADRAANDNSKQQIDPRTPIKTMKENKGSDTVVIEDDKQQSGNKRVNHIRNPKPKRKRHRPKVVRDVNPAVKNPVTPKQVIQKRTRGNKNGKSQVRKRKNQNSVNDTPEAIREADVCSSEIRDFYEGEHVEKEHCKIKRRLDFNEEKGIGVPSSGKESYFNVKPDYAAKTSFHVAAQGVEMEIENSAGSIAFDPNRSLNHMLNEYAILPECLKSSYQPSRREILKSNWKNLARSAEDVEAVAYPSLDESSNIQNSYSNESHVSCFMRPFNLGAAAIYESKPAKRATRKRSKVMIIHRKPTCVIAVTISNQTHSCMTALLTDNSLKVKKKKRTRKNQRFVELARSFNNIVEDDLHNLHIVPVQEIEASSSLMYASWANLTSQAIVPYLSQRNAAHYQGSLDVTSNTENMLIPYGTRMVVPFVNHAAEIKKRRPKAKVDLDEETNRMWNLLMDKESSDAQASSDIDKEKWWEKERKKFQDRVDKFLSCMHYIQGDRRFSPWKGSVLDSVIGVFLTQNVSDVLSSTAFMTMAATYPAKPKSSTSKSSSDITETPIEKQDESISVQLNETQLENKLDLKDYGQRTEDAERSEEKIDQSSLDGTKLNVNVSDGQNCIFYHEASNHVSDVSEAANNDVGFEVKCSQEDVLSSQNSNSPCASSQNSRSQVSNYSGSQIQTDFKMDMLSGAMGKSTSFLFNGQSSILGANKIEEVHNCKHSEVLEKFAATSLKSYEEAVNGESEINKVETEWCCQEAGSRSKQNTMNGSFVSSMLYCDSMTKLEPGIVKESIGHIMPEKSYQSCEIPTQFSGECQKEQVLPAEKFQSTFEAKAKRQESILRDACPGSQSHTKNEVCNQQITQERKSGQKSQKVKPAPHIDWDSLRKEAIKNGYVSERSDEKMDAINWDAVRCADVKDIAKTIRHRGMENILAGRIKNFLGRSVKDHGSLDLEWLRNIPQEKSKEYLLSVDGLGLKSAECVRLLSLHQHAFPVDTNVARIFVRLGWVPIQPLPETLQFYLLDLYPPMEHIQKYIWPRLCKLDQATLYELHYQMITFGKVFCTKRKPNCNACPMKADCKHFASAYASEKLALPAPQGNSLVNNMHDATESYHACSAPLPQHQESNLLGATDISEPIIEEPATPERESIEALDVDIEDLFYEDIDEIPHLQLNMENFKRNLQNYIEENMELEDGDIQKALVALTAEAASIPIPKLKYAHRLRTEHQAYVLPDSHPLLEGLEDRERDDPCPYLLVVWTPGETPETCCSSAEIGGHCKMGASFSSNTEQIHLIRGTLLIPCRTAMRGRFPLNGTYFQVNEVFADHKSSQDPILVPRKWLWNLQKCTVYMGSNTSGIFAGESIDKIRACFWKGFICVRGFDQETRSPKPLARRLHLPAAARRKENPAKVEKPDPANVEKPDPAKVGKPDPAKVEKPAACKGRETSSEQRPKQYSD